jgi:hypothetical protein
LSALERELHKASETDRKDTSRFDEDNYDDYGKWAASEP